MCFFRYFARDLVEKVVPNKLQTQKLTYIHNLVKSPLFFNPGNMFSLKLYSVNVIPSS